MPSQRCSRSRGGRRDAVRVNHVSFEVDNPERFEGEARDKAVADARARAEQLAKAAGVKLGPARSVNETFGGGPPVPDALEAVARPRTASRLRSARVRPR